MATRRVVQAAGIRKPLELSMWDAGRRDRAKIPILVGKISFTARERV
jgi:hypothetical protein